MDYLISKRYAQALLELSQETKIAESIYKDLIEIQSMLNHSKDLDAFLQNPVILIDYRRKIIDQIFKPQTNPLTYKFICLLNIKKRLHLLRNICSVFEDLYFEESNIRRVKITSNTDLTSKQISDISNHFQSRIKKIIEAEPTVDPSMLGGIKIQDGDTIYDYSIKTQLEQFQKNLMKA